MTVKKVKRKRFNIFKFLKFLLFLFILGFLIYYLSKIPIKNIVIKGTDNIKDIDIIEIANIENYPSFIKTSSKKIEKNIKMLELVSSVKVRKKWRFVLEINIIEEKVLFRLKNTNEYITSSYKRISNINIDKRNIPVLINEVDESVLDRMVKKMVKIDSDILGKVSEIEYTPTTYDKDRFLLYMCDENLVYITLNKTKELNEYNKIKQKLGLHKGILYLDSGNYFEIKE